MSLRRGPGEQCLAAGAGDAIIEIRNMRHMACDATIFTSWWRLFGTEAKAKREYRHARPSASCASACNAALSSFSLNGN